MHKYDERIIPHRDFLDSHTFFSEHLARYMFADRVFPHSGTVLDICCGCGYGTAHLAEIQGRTVLGVDSSTEAIAYARQQYKNPGLSYVRADVMRLPTKPDSFDAVLALEALEHLHDPKAMLRQVQLALKPGGIFLASTPNRLITKSGEVPPNPFHVREYTPEEFRDLLAEEFSDISLYGEALSPAFLVYERSLQCLWRSLWLMRGLYYEQREALGNLERITGLTWLRTLKRKIMGKGAGSRLQAADGSPADGENWAASLREEFEQAKGAVAGIADWQITPYGIDAAPILLAVCRK